MRKKIAMALLLIYFLGVLLPVSLFANELTKVYVNGMKLGVYPIVKEGVAYLPANAMAQSLGIKILWNTNNRILKVNDNVVDASPLISGGKLYLPVEAIGQGAGATVEWDGASNAIRITGGSKTNLVASTGNAPKVPAVTPTPRVTPAYKKPVKKTTTVTGPALTAPKPSISYQDKPQNRKPVRNVPAPGIIHKPPTSYSGQPTKSAYPDKPQANSPLRPKDAPPTMPSNLSLPPMSTTGQVSSRKTTFSSTSPFIPRSEKNNIFRVTITNMEYVDSIKDYYKPKPGYRFVVVYLSQQNISDAVQIYTGRFSLLDQNNSSYDYIEGLSNFWLVILRPGGINFGYLVFEIPADAKPMSAVLHALNQQPLTVKLR